MLSVSDALEEPLLKYRYASHYLFNTTGVALN